MFFKEFQCVLEISKNNQLLNVYSTVPSKISDFLSFVDHELTQIDFDLNIVEDQAKLKELCTDIESQPDLVFLINGDKIQLAGFNEKLDFFYNQLISI